MAPSTGPRSDLVRAASRAGDVATDGHSSFSSSRHDLCAALETFSNAAVQIPLAEGLRSCWKDGHFLRSGCQRQRKSLASRAALSAASMICQHLFIYKIEADTSESNFKEAHLHIWNQYWIGSSRIHCYGSQNVLAVGQLWNPFWRHKACGLHNRKSCL